LKFLRTLAITSALLFALLGAVGAQTWTPLTNQPGVNVGAMLQLRDGRILVHEEQAGNAGAWHILTPDSTGSYINGTWSSGGLLPSGYAPFYFGSQVLLDGKTVVIEGGEYNNGSAAWTTLGAIGTISGSTLTWTSNSPPAGWSTLGDAESVILADGTYMQANCCTAQNALFNGPNSWTATGSVLQSSNDESGFTLLSNDLVLTVDAKSDSPCGTSKGSELYDQGTGVWSCGPSTPVQLYNSADEELGAAVLMYNNKVLQFGGNVVATAIYDVANNTWSAGPTPAGGLNQADGPAALEPNGKVLAMLSPGLFQSGCQFVEYDPVASSLTNTANPANCPSDSSFVGHLMVLPTGQIMFTDFSGGVEIYTPAAGVVSGVAPTINSVSGTINSPSTNNALSGAQLNGLTENNAYGDDYQAATNYPLVQLVQVDPPNNVYYATTHNESTHSIAPSTLATTQFDVPAGLPSGNYTLFVIANGIKSNPVTVTVGNPAVTLNPTSLTWGSVQVGKTGAKMTVKMTNSGTATLHISNIGISGDFALVTSTKPCGSTLAVGANCLISATFSPTQTGLRNGDITITDDASDSPQQVPLSGTGTGSSGKVTLTPTSATFPKTKVGYGSSATQFTLNNQQTVPLANIMISTTGDFSVTSTSCPNTLSALASCTINVIFTPTQTGTRTGLLRVNDSAAGAPQTSSLTGTGK
jgi:hypothetical protein